ncbi:MAG: hypothetical protein CMD35_01670 [Flavobacteriales bacterium]|nr:hypothetical protein [Flavobacteriales bacterium]
MKKIVALLFATVLFVSADVEVSDIKYKSNEKFLGGEYVLNGAGVREKWFIDLYAIGLYVKEKSSDGSVILDSDANKFVRIVIVSSLITAEKFHKGLNDGFEKSTQGKTDSIKKEIALVRNGFGSDFAADDEFIVYFDKSGETKIYKSGKETVKVPANKDFQKALLGMWIGEYPVLDDLKDELLGTD